MKIADLKIGLLKIKYLIFITFLILIVTTLVYSQAMSLPFIQDDWGKIQFFQANDFKTILKSIFSIQGKLFYRPIADLYLFIVFLIFGANPISFHILALSIHAINSILLKFIIYKITEERVISSLISIVYASAIAIHIEPLAWSVGIYDLGGALFFFLSFWLFLKEKFGITYVFYFIGCFVKESVLVLPFLLLFYYILKEYDFSSIRKMRAKLIKFIPFFLIMIFILLMRFVEVLPHKLSPEHPYFIKFLGMHIIENLQAYFKWMFQTFIPFDFLKYLPGRLFLYMGIIISIFLIFASYKKKTFNFRIIFFMITWIVIALLPVIFFPNHTYRYYATYCLPPFIFLIFCFVKYVSNLIFINKKYTLIILLAVCFHGVIGSVITGFKIYREGLQQKLLADGTNLLIKRATYVNIVRENLYKLFPVLPVGSVLVFSNIDLWAFNKNSGPRFWYSDPSIQVYNINELKFDEKDRPYIKNPVNNQIEGYVGSSEHKILLEKTKLFVFEFKNNKFSYLSLDESKNLVIK